MDEKFYDDLAYLLKNDHEVRKLIKSIVKESEAVDIRGKESA